MILPRSSKVLFCFYTIWLFQNVHALFKLTSARCENHDRTYFILDRCILKPFSREISKLYVNGTAIKEVHRAWMHGYVSKRTIGGFKPFLWNVTVDVCSYLEKKNNPLLNLAFKEIKQFSTLNHSCPYFGKQSLDGYYTRNQLLSTLPLPPGEYGLFTTWYFHDVKSISVDAFAVYEN